jgi:hypothetical protein
MIVPDTRNRRNRKKWSFWHQLATKKLGKNTAAAEAHIQPHCQHNLTEKFKKSPKLADKKPCLYYYLMIIMNSLMTFVWLFVIICQLFHLQFSLRSKSVCKLQFQANLNNNQSTIWIENVELSRIGVVIVGARKFSEHLQSSKMPKTNSQHFFFDQCSNLELVPNELLKDFQRIKNWDTGSGQAMIAFFIA